MKLRKNLTAFKQILATHGFSIQKYISETNSLKSTNTMRYITSGIEWSFCRYY